MSDIILEVKNLSKSFGPVQALKNVNLAIRRNEIHAICGENGAGKSTLMKVLDGFYNYGSYDGDFFLDGKKCVFMSPKESIANGIAMIYQEINILRFMTIADNIYAGDFPVRFGMVMRAELQQRAEEILKLVDLNMPPGTIAGTLNSSQQQLLMIAHALVKKPKILILDEPTSALTLSEFHVLMNILRNLKEGGVTCIYISHKLDELTKIADRLTILKDGETIETLEKSEFDIKRVISGMVGRKMENMYPSRETNIGEEVLRVEGLTVPNERLKGRSYVERLSFSLRKGEILGLAGLVGAGRSETLNAIYGYIRKKEGNIFIEGKLVNIETPQIAITHGIVLLTEDRKTHGLYDGCSVKKNITSSSISQICKWVLIDSKKENKIAEESVEKLRIKTMSINTAINNLSGGNQQKVVLAKALLTNPKIVFLDEPTRGIDVGSKFEIYQIMNELVSRGYSIIMVSSELPELLNMCDRIIVISRSRMVAEFQKGEATEENVIRAAATAGAPE